MSVSFIARQPSLGLRAGKVLLTAAPIIIFLFILNKNIAFTGAFQVTIRSFLHLPRNVQYDSSSEIGVVSTTEGLQARPFSDRAAFSVTLPRGFDAITMRAVINTDKFAAVTLGAIAPLQSGDQTTTIRLPSAYTSDWRAISFGTGALYVKGHPEIQNVDDFWDNYSTLKNVYSIGSNLFTYMPAALYRANGRVVTVHLPGAYRSNMQMDIFVDGKAQEVTFDSQLVYTAGTESTVAAAFERDGVVIASTNVNLSSKKMQHVSLAIPSIQPGFYTLRFLQSSEATVVSNVQFRGSAVLLGKELFFDQSTSPLRLYTKCPNFTVEAAHSLSATSPLIINNANVIIAAEKKPQVVQANASLNTLIFPHADVRVTNACGFMVSPDDTVRQQFDKLTHKSKVVSYLSASVEEQAELIYDPVPLLAQKNLKGETITLEKSFDLHKLTAKGKTFTFFVEVPGMNERTGSFLHLKQVSFTAQRPPLRLDDIRKFFVSILKDI